MINGYDFDETIYDGDSSVDFYFFCLRKNKKVLKQLPEQIKSFIKYNKFSIDNVFNTYEEAQEAGIKKAIEILLKEGE